MPSLNVNNTFEEDHSADPYYYIKKSRPFIDVGPAQHQDQLAEIVNYATENKNPLNLIVPTWESVTIGIKQIPHTYYSWNLPFCFSWEQYRVGALEGVTLYRIATDFFNGVADMKTDELHPEGFTLFSAELILIPPGERTMRGIVNPGGPRSYRWYRGGSCKLMIPLKVNPGVVVEIGGEFKTPDQYQVMEINDQQVYQFNNNGTEDFIYLTVNLVPTSKAEILEQRLLNHTITQALHVVYASGFPVHNTVFNS